MHWNTGQILQIYGFTACRKHHQGWGGIALGCVSWGRRGGGEGILTRFAIVTGAVWNVYVLTISSPCSSLLKDVCEQRHDRSLPEQNAKWTIDLCMISISWIFSGGGRSRYNIYRIHQVDPTTIAGTGEVCARKGRKTVFFNTRRSETVNTSHMDRILS